MLKKCPIKILTVAVNILMLLCPGKGFTGQHKKIKAIAYTGNPFLLEDMDTIFPGSVEIEYELNTTTSELIFFEVSIPATISAPAITLVPNSQTLLQALNHVVIYPYGVMNIDSYLPDIQTPVDKFGVVQTHPMGKLETSYYTEIPVKMGGKLRTYLDSKKERKLGIVASDSILGELGKIFMISFGGGKLYIRVQGSKSDQLLRSIRDVFNYKRKHDHDYDRPGGAGGIPIHLVQSRRNDLLDSYTKRLYFTLLRDTTLDTDWFFYPY